MKLYLTTIIVFLSLNLLSAQEKPNVLFIAVDDLNDWVGCFGGNPQVKTPNIDKFHENGGMIMFKAHTPSPVCGPARSAILTGKAPYNTGVYGNKTNLKNSPKAQNLITLPEYFSKHGYTTISRGKIFHHHESNKIIKGKNFDAGQWAFDEWFPSPKSIGPLSKKRPVNGLPNLPNERQSYHKTAFDWGPTAKNDEAEMKDFKVAQWTSKILNERNFNDKPFFMAIGLSKPHLPLYVPQKYFDMYPLKNIKLPKTKPNDLNDVLNSKGIQGIKPLEAWLRLEKYGDHKEAVRAYLATVSFVDDCIGIILDGLSNSKYADNTIVILWSDNGWYLGEKQRYGKTSLWQEACRVPLMVKVPGVTPKSKVSQGVVNLLDLYPTLIDLCGLPANPENDGRSFAELIHKPDMSWNFPTLTTMGYRNHRIYDGRHSYSIFSS